MPPKQSKIADPSTKSTKQRKPRKADAKAVPKKTNKLNQRNTNTAKVTIQLGKEGVAQKVPVYIQAGLPPIQNAPLFNPTTNVLPPPTLNAGSSTIPIQVNSPKADNVGAVGTPNAPPVSPTPSSVGDQVANVQQRMEQLAVSPPKADNVGAVGRPNAKPVLSTTDSIDTINLQQTADQVQQQLDERQKRWQDVFGSSSSSSSEVEGYTSRAFPFADYYMSSPPPRGIPPIIKEVGTTATQTDYTFTPDDNVRSIRYGDNRDMSTSTSIDSIVDIQSKYPMLDPKMDQNGDIIILNPTTNNYVKLTSPVGRSVLIRFQNQPLLKA